MSLPERIDYLTYVFDLLQDTNSRIEKELIVKDIKPEYREDFNYVLECLAGKHKFGFRYYECCGTVFDSEVYRMTVKQVLEFLQIPMKTGDLTISNINKYVTRTAEWYYFLEPIVNRTLRLGIGQSLLDKGTLSPMLAKKFDGYAKYDKDGYYITEKLDGNRCIAHFDYGEWKFTSRNGKDMYVNFDMSGLDTNLIYDGEVLSPKQVELSRAIEEGIKYNMDIGTAFDDQFSATSGLINRHNTNKQLVYNVFDIIDSASYKERREALDQMKPQSDDVRILPVLKHFKDTNELQEVWDILNKVTGVGGEGVMINLANSSYLHKRTDQLLKLKKVYTMDMKVYNVEWGIGKYEGQIGALKAEAITDSGISIHCSVGTGLSDEQREMWARDIRRIIGKTIEVSYFSLSQTKEDRELGNNVYSLRFPRLKRVRDDKTETSEY